MVLEVLVLGMKPSAGEVGAARTGATKKNAKIDDLVRSRPGIKNMILTVCFLISRRNR